MKLTLTREQRARFFAGECPRITGEGKCPVAKGYVYALSSRLSFEVTGVQRSVTFWALHYTLTDRRDNVRNLRRVPTISFDAMRADLDDYGYPEEPTSDVLARAAQESAYTTQPTSLSDAGEAVDRKTLTQFVKDNRKRFESHRAASLSERIERVQEEAQKEGVDLRRWEKSVEQRVQAAERKLRGKAA